MSSPINSNSDFTAASPGDLHWRAFQYAHGELSPDDAASFEQVLLADQAAREAVLAAAKLTHAVRAASTGLPSAGVMPAARDAGKKSTSQQARWFAAGIAVCAAVCVGEAMDAINSRRDYPTQNQRVPASAQVRALALRWSELNAVADLNGFGFPGDNGQGTLAADSTPWDAVDRSPFEASDEDAAPGWMLSAVTRGAM